MAKAFKLFLTLVRVALQASADPSGNYRLRPIRSVIVVLPLTVLFLATCAIGAAQEGEQGSRQPLASPPPQATPQREAEGPSYTFKTVSSIVVVGLVVRDKEDNPVRDLTISDIHVS